MAIEKDALSNYVHAKDCPDGGYGWIIVFASFVLFTIADGLAFSVGQFEHIWTTSLGASNYLTSFATSLFVSVPLLLAPFASIATDRWGCRKVTMFGGILASIGFISTYWAKNIYIICITYGLITGIGLSFAYIPPVIILTHYFKKRHPLAAGIAYSGSGLGTVIGPRTCQFLIDNYSWEGALLVLGGILLNITVCGALFRPLNLTKTTSINSKLSSMTTLSKSNKSLDKENVQTTNAPHKRMWSSCPILPVEDDTNLNGKLNFFKKLVKRIPSDIFKFDFLLFVFCTSLIFMWSDIPYVFNQNLAVERYGFSDSSASFLTSMMGASNSFGQIFVGWLANKNIIKVNILYMIYTLLAGLALISMPLNNNYVYLSSMCVIYGWFLSADHSLSTVLILKIVDASYIGWAIGLMYMCQGFANLIGPPIAGFIIDETSRFFISYLVSGMFLIIASFFLLFIRVDRKDETDHKKLTEVNQLIV